MKKGTPCSSACCPAGAVVMALEADEENVLHLNSSPAATAASRYLAFTAWSASMHAGSGAWAQLCNASMSIRNC